MSPLAILLAAVLVQAFPNIASAAPVWDRVWDGGDFEAAHGAAVDAAGNVYTTGNSGSNINVVRLSSSGVILSTWTYDSGQSDAAWALSLDTAGNVYAAGQTFNGANNDFRFVKFTSTGGVALTRSYNGGGTDIAWGAGAAADGTVVVGGTSDSDWRLMKYTSTGAVVWSRSYDSGLPDSMGALAVDAAGNAYAVGYHDASGDYDVKTVKFDSSGNIVWVSTYATAAAETARGVALDASGNAYVVGSQGTDFLLLKFSTAGTLAWSRTWDSGRNDRGYAVTVDASGRVFAAGSSEDAASINNDFRLWRYDPDGTLVSATLYEDVFNNSEGRGVAVDNAGAVYLSGLGNASDYRMLRDGYVFSGALSSAPLGGAFVSSMAVSWGSTFVPGTSYVAQASTASDFSGTLASSTTLNLAAGISGLSPNTSYYVRVATSLAGPFTPLGSTVTLAAAPALSVLVSVTTQSVRFAWDQNGNPPGTAYQATLSTMPTFAPQTPGAWSVDATSVTISGLSPYTTYYVRVRARSRTGTATDYDVTLTTRTDPRPVEFAFYWGDIVGTYGPRSATWGDYDGDGDLDVAAAVYDPYGSFNRVYRNDGNASFTKVWTSTETEGSRAAAWGDYDNDGDLDLAVGINKGSFPYDPNVRLYRNDAGSFSLVWVSTENGDCEGISWGDYDNDGRVDLLVANSVVSPPYTTRVYRNMGNGAFSASWAAPDGPGFQSAAWGDYDNDGRLDIVAGAQGSPGKYTRIYRNSGSGFALAWSSTQTGVGKTAQWADVDQDGRLDFLTLDGQNDYRLRYYRNDGSTFTLTTAASVSLDDALALGDVDADGDLDAATQRSGSGSSGANDVFANDGTGRFSPVWVSTHGFSGGTAELGDMNGDGKPDLLVSDCCNWESPKPRIYLNVSPRGNALPASPSGGFSTAYAAGVLSLRWSAGSDAETSAGGLRYLVRAGTAPGASNLLSDAVPPALGTFQHPFKLGVNQLGRNLSVSLAPGATVYWSVRTLDGGTARSAPSAETSWVVGTPVSTKVWDGGGGTPLASEAANWVGDAAPIGGDYILFNAAGGSSSCTWNMPLTIGGMTVAAGYSARVTVSSNVTITGDVTLESGSLIMPYDRATIDILGSYRRSGSAARYWFEGRVRIAGDLTSDGINGDAVMLYKSTVEFNGTSHQTVSDAAGWGYLPWIDVNSSSEVAISVSNEMAVNGGVTIRSGRLVLSSGIANGLLVAGDWTQTGGEFRANQNLISFRELNPPFLLRAITTIPGSPFYQLRFSSGTNYRALSSLEVEDDLKIFDAAFDPGAFTHTVGGDWVQSGGSAFRPSSGTIRLYGGSGANVTQTAGSWFKTLEVAMASTVTFTSSVVASTLSAQTSGATLRFYSGTTVTVSALNLGATGLPDRVRLRSASPGAPWHLVVASTASVARTDVSDSDASGGLTIRGAGRDNLDSGGNLNWDLGAPDPEVFATSLTLHWGQMFAAGTPYYASLSTSAGFSGTSLSSTTFNRYASFTGLTPNTSYYARMSTAPLGPFSSLGSTVTLAVPPTLSALISVTTQSVRFGWGQNGNPPGTSYQAAVSTMPTFAPQTLGAWSVDAASATVSGLSPYATYYVRVRSRSRTGIPAEYDVTLATRTDPRPVEFVYAWGFPSPGTYGAGGAAWGDYDGDGLDDIAVSARAPSYGDANKVFRNNGDETFTAVWTSTQTEESWGVAWGDYDRDGDLDLAYGNAGTSQPTIRLYRNDGGGAFALVWVSTETDRNKHLRWGDYDNDGFVDILASNDFSSTPRTRVYRNLGDGRFSRAWSAPDPDGFTDAVWGDFDADGLLDILSGGYGPARVYRNTGSGFALAWASTATYIGRSVRWADLDHDGKLDFLALDGSSDYRLRYYRYDGSTFTLTTVKSVSLDESLALGDVDADGDLDGATQLDGSGGAGANNVFANDGAGVFAVRWSAAESFGGAGTADLGDMNGDGRPDLLATHCCDSGTAKPRVYRNVSPASNSPPSAPVTGLSASYDSAAQTLSLRWDAGSDDKTPAAGLRYVVRAGTAPGTSNILSDRTPPFIGSFLHPQKLSPTQLGRSVRVALAAGDPVYWSVRALDGGTLRGPASSEQTFVVPSFPVAARFTSPLRRLLPGTTEAAPLGDASSSAVDVELVDAGGNVTSSSWAFHVAMVNATDSPTLRAGTDPTRPVAAGPDWTLIGPSDPPLAVTIAPGQTRARFYVWDTAVGTKTLQAVVARQDGFTMPTATQAVVIETGFRSAAFSEVSASSLTLTWLSDFSTGTSYSAQLATAADFSGSLLSSATFALSATFSGLDPGATYYARVATSAAGAFTVFGSTRTRLDPPAGCVTAYYVRQSGGADCTTIQACVDLIPTAPLAGDACVAVLDGAEYFHFAVRGKAPNGNRIVIGGLPGGPRPRVRGDSTEAVTIAVANASVTLRNLSVYFPTARAVVVSSPNAVVEDVYIDQWAPATALTVSSWTTVTRASVAFTSPFGGAGILVTGAGSVISQSTTSGNGRIELVDASSNTLSGLYAANDACYGLTLERARNNTVRRSTVTGAGSGCAGLKVFGGADNLFEELAVSGSGTAGAWFDTYAGENARNTVRRSTVTGGAAGSAAVHLQGVEAFTLEDSWIHAGAGDALRLETGSFAVSRSTLTSSAEGQAALYAETTNGPSSVTGSYLQGSTGAWLNGVSGVVLAESVLVATRNAGDGLRLWSGSSDVALRSLTVLGGSGGNAAYVSQASNVLITASTFTASGSGGRGLQMIGVDSATVSAVYAYSPSFYAGWLDAVTGVSVERSTFARDGGASNGVFSLGGFNGPSSSNTLSASRFYSGFGAGVSVGGGSSPTSSTTIRGCAFEAASATSSQRPLGITAPDTLVADSRVANPLGEGVLAALAPRITLLRSTVTAASNGLQVLLASSVTVSDSYIAAATSVYVNRSSDVLVERSWLAGTQAGLAYSAQSGSLNVSSTAVSGATGIVFLGGPVVSTFAGVAFGPGTAVNVDGQGLGAASSLTMRDASGARSGPAFESDPDRVVHWAGASFPSPAAPPTPQGTGLGVSSVAWTWGPSAGAWRYDVYSVSSGTLLARRSTQNFTLTGLAPNTAYGVRVAAVGADEASVLSAAGSAFTAAAPPTGTTATAVHATSATVSWNLNGNPVGTTAEVQRSTDAAAYAAVFVGTAAERTEAGLQGCSTYYFRVRNRGFDGADTAFDSVLSFVTLPSTPLPAGELSAESLPGSRIRLTWVPSPDPGLSGYRLYYDSGTGTVDYGTPLASLGPGATAYTTGTLANGVVYRFGLRARNRCGREEGGLGSVAAAPALGSLSGVRAAIKVPASGKRVSGNRVLVMAELAGGEPERTREVRFQYRASSAPAWADVPAANLQHPNPDSAHPYFVHWDVSGLPPGDYDLRAVATDVFGSSDPAPGLVSVSVDPVNFEVRETDQGGGRVKKEQTVNNAVPNTLAAAESGSAVVTKVMIPAGAVSASTTVVTMQVNPVGAPPHAADVLPVGATLEVNLGNGQSLLAGGQTAALVFNYPDSDGDGVVDGTQLRAAKLSIVTYDALAGRWKQEFAAEVDETARTVTGRTPHFSFFSLIGAAAANLSAATVYPNPWKPNGGNPNEGKGYVPGDATSGVVFDNLPASVRITIYTLDGTEVESFATDAGTGSVQWDGRNSSGQNVASGVYFAVVKSPGSEPLVLKFGVVR